MPRISGFRGTWEQNQRPYVVLAPDAYMALQGETSVIACGECQREVNFNHYVTQISTEASVDSPPGSATVNLSIPDTEVNDFYINDQFMIIPMMEIELYAKGYFTIGGMPQYYKIFWGLVSSVTKSWANGVTTIQLSCKDILRWWELTNVTINPAFLDPFGSSAGGYQLFNNRFAGMNPYTVILTLAKESMGDFSLTTGSFTSFKPEHGPEGQVIGSYSKDVMAYWQLKFGNIWNSLVLYGTSGTAYTLAGPGGTVNAVEISKEIFKAEATKQAADGKQVGLGEANEQFKIHPSEIAAFKIEVDRAGDVEFFQNDTQTKLSVAMIARDQAGYEFYCDTTGDIIFKPPFYNMNVLPNKPVSWIQDFEIIDDSVVDSEAEVYTHVTSSGNAFGGVTDWGLNDEITTPRTGVFDFHLLRRYGWRRLDYQCEWAGNPRKLFFHLMDYLDRVNAKRQNGTITIPLRPELRMGFPVWIPKYDSFFYIQGISHNYAPGGQATTTLNLIAKRSKFIAPDNIGKIEQTGKTKPSGGIPTPQKGSSTASDDKKKKGQQQQDKTQRTYRIDFPQHAGETSGLATASDSNFGKPVEIRDPKTGKLLGFPNAVMVFTRSFDDKVIGQIMKEAGSTKGNQSPNPGGQDKTKSGGAKFSYAQAVADNFRRILGAEKADALAKLRAHRYEAGMTNAGGYDYAWDKGQNFKEMGVIAVDTIEWGPGLQNPKGYTTSKEEQQKVQKQKQDELADKVKAQQAVVDQAKTAFKQASDAYDSAKKTFDAYMKTTYKGKIPADNKLTPADLQQKALFDQAKAAKATAAQNLKDAQDTLSGLQLGAKGVKLTSSLNMMVRPVSDEFGFEVIGHYRYGRGTFIDRGKVKILDGDGSVANKINIQFAATGGLLTDGPKINNASSATQNFSQAFEDMRPDDYLTGASFDHGDDNKGDPQNFNPTGQNTYVNAINDTIARSGSAVFVEADATRRSLTLAELKPTLDVGLGEVTEKCACAVNKTAWLELLPQDALDQILKPETFARQPSGSAFQNQPSPPFPEGSTAQTLQAIGLVGTDQSQQAAHRSTELAIAESQNGPGTGLGNVSLSVTNTANIGTDQTPEKQSVGMSAGGVPFAFNTGGFFDILRGFLADKFSTDYQSNLDRERQDTGEAREIQNPNLDPAEDTNLLGDPSDPLFQRAANGDPNALAALQNQVNFNFGATKDQLSNFNQTLKAAGDRIKQSASDLASAYGNMGPSSFIGLSATTAPPGQQQQQDLARQQQAASENVSSSAAALAKDPGNPALQQQYNSAQQALATVNAQAAKASGDPNAAKQQLVLQRREGLSSALTQFDTASNLLLQHPNDPVFLKAYQDAQAALGQAQQALKAAEDSPASTDSAVLYQPPAVPPQIGGILNPKFFDAERADPAPVRKGP